MEPRHEGSPPPYESPIKYEIRNPEGLLDAFNSEGKIQVGPEDTFSPGPSFLNYRNARILGLSEREALGTGTMHLDKKTPEIAQIIQEQIKNHLSPDIIFEFFETNEANPHNPNPYYKVTRKNQDGEQLLVTMETGGGFHAFLEGTESVEDFEKQIRLAMEIFRIYKTETYKANNVELPEDISPIIIDGDYRPFNNSLSDFFKIDPKKNNLTSGKEIDSYIQYMNDKILPNLNPVELKNLPTPEELEDIMNDANIPQDLRDMMRLYVDTQRRILSDKPGLTSSELNKLADEQTQSSRSKKTEKVKKTFGVERTPELQGLRQSIVVEDKPDVKFEDIAGQDKAVSEARDLAKILSRRDEIEKMYGPDLVPRGILFYGPPGTGKTMIAKALANEAEAGFVMVKAPDLASKWYGDSEKFAKGVFDIAREVASEQGHCILYVDEVDAILPPRNRGNGHEVTNRVISTFLQEIDGLSTEAGQITVVASTNLPDNVEPAFLSRMSSWVEVPLPDANGRYKILESHFKKRAEMAGKSTLLDDSIDLKEIMESTEGLSGRDISDLVQVILRRKGIQALDHGFQPVTSADIYTAIKESTKTRGLQNDARKRVNQMGFRPVDKQQ